MSGAHRSVSATRCGARGLLHVALLAPLVAGCAQAPAGSGQNQPPTALFSASPVHGPAPLAVAFDGSSSTDPDGSVTAYAWQFGDGGTASGVASTHTYATPGVFTAQLTVTDDRGASASAQRDITVTTEDGNVPPTAAFTATPEEGAAPLTVAFDASASADPDGSIVGYAWDYGDGSTGSGVTTTHTYPSPGSYVASLTVTDDGGSSATASTTIAVGGGGAIGGDRLHAIDTAFQVSEAVILQPAILIASSVDAAIEATRLNGGVPTVTGTLTETSAQVYAYAPEPGDRLRLVLLDGRSWEMTFDALDGADFTDGDRYVRGAHAIDLRITSNAAAGSVDLRVASQPGAGAGEQVGSLVGAFDDGGGHRWSVDAAYESFVRSEVGAGYNELESILTVHGSLSSAPQGIAMDLGRYRRYILVNTVENFDHRMDHAVTWGGAAYRLQGRVFVGFRNGVEPVDRDQWVIAGGLTENGVEIGAFDATEDPSGLSVWLQVGAERFKMFFFSYF